ncbi:MAG TPA: hypothetical protein VHY37_14275 [Tepidisphaeraceae bacterium]|jgi:hypothetical protein|nr:hypothetical protein [Tepidisphaeraceae bacterium]
MTFTFTAAGAVLIFTLLRLFGNERERAQRLREAKLATEAELAALAEPPPAISPVAAKPPAAKPPVKKAA